MKEKYDLPALPPRKFFRFIIIIINDDNTGILYPFEMKIGMNECDHHILPLLILSSSEKCLKNSGLNGDSNPDLCDAGAVLHRWSYQANWEQIIM